MSLQQCLHFVIQIIILLACNFERNLVQADLACQRYEENRICGPKCPVTCDTLNTNVCCDVHCVSGCFCQDGFMLVSNQGPRKCVPINDCPKPGILDFQDPVLTVLESTKVVKIVVLRLNGTAGEISVGWRTVDGTAKAQSDFVPSNGILVFPEGVTSRIITIEIVDDTIREQDEFFAVVLSDPTNKAEINPTRLEGIKITIQDDDMRPGYITIENVNITVPENFGSVLVNLVRVGGHDGAISIRYRTADGTARANDDYVPATGKVTFNEGERRKTVPITILDDDIREPTESFSLQFFDPRAAANVINFRQPSSSLSVTVTIIDNDMRPGYIGIENSNITVLENTGFVLVTCVRLGGTDGVIGIQYRTLDGTARAQSDYVPNAGEITFLEGEVRKAIPVAIIDDDVLEPTENFQLQIFDPKFAPGVTNFKQLSSRLSTVVTILDNDMKPGCIEVELTTITVVERIGIVNVNLIRIGGTNGQIQIRYRTVDGTARASTDFIPSSGVIVFRDGDDRKSIPISVFDDDIREPSESFQLLLFDPSAAQNVMNFIAPTSRQSTTIIIMDDDMKPGYLELEQENMMIREDSGPLRVTVVRVRGSDGILRVKYKELEVTASPQSDYVPVFGELVFSDGETRKSIDIPIVNDDTREPLETFKFQLYDFSAGPDTINFSPMGSKLTALITIIDDDMKPGYLELEQENITVREDCGQMPVPIIRVGGSDGILRVKYKELDVTALAQSDYVPVFGELVFENGETRKSIDIPIVNDDIRESLEIFKLQLYDFSAGPDTINFRPMGSRLTTVITILDDDMKPGYLELEQENVTVREDYGLLRINVVRVGGSDGILRVKYQELEVTASAQSDYVPVFGELVFSDGETRKSIDIPIVNDDTRESLETFQLQLYDFSAGTDTINFRAMGSRLIAFITIIDDDLRPGYFEVSNSVVTVPESIGEMSINVLRVDGQDGEIRTRFRTVDGTAVAPSDYISCSGELVFNDGVTLLPITIRITDDPVTEPVETFRLELFEPTAAPDVFNFKSHSNKMSTIIRILDDDMKPGYLELEQLNITVNENYGTLQVPVIRIGGSDGILSLKYRTVDISATSQSDYVPITGDLVFNSGETKKSIAVDILNDRVRESPETFKLQLYDFSAGSETINFKALGTRLTTLITIIDDDDYPGVFDFQTDRLTVPESIRSLTLTIVRKDGSNGRVSLQLRTTSSSATEGADFVPPPRSVEFPDGVTERSVRIQIIDDDVREGDESFVVGIFNPTNGGLLGNNKLVTVVILDDDDPSVIRFVRRSGSCRQGDGFVEVPVEREGRLDRRVSVKWRTEDRSARAGRDYQGVSSASLSFEPGETRKTLRIRFLPTEAVRYDSRELFDVVLFDPCECSVLGDPSRFTVLLSDSNVPEQPCPLINCISGCYLDKTAKPCPRCVCPEQPCPLINCISGCLLDKTAKPCPRCLCPEPFKDPVPSIPGVIRLSFSETNIRVREDVGVVRISISRSGLMDPFTVRIRTVDGSASGGSDFRRISGLLNFKIDDIKITIALRILNDDVYEPEETFTIELSEPSLGIISLERSTVTVTIVDDDDATSSDLRPGSNPVPDPDSTSGSRGVGLLTKCPSHLILKECASSCPPTCDSLFGKVSCSNNGDCIRGCFCPEGLVKESEKSDVCVNPSQCPKRSSQTPVPQPPKVQRSRPFGILF